MTAQLPGRPPPRWVSWLIALVPVFPPLYLAALGSLGALRGLPLSVRRLLFFFAATQLVAALFTPQPALSLALAVARTLLILAMVAAGALLQESRRLRPLLWGQLAVFASAWIYTLATQGLSGLQQRLGHPYYYVVSLGLVATVALWLIVYWRGGGWWRWPAGGLALATLLAAGSRGPLLALFSGTLAALAFQKGHRRPWALLPAALILALVVASSGRIDFQPVERLLNDQTNGREVIWQDALRGWQTSPLGGVGPYQGGPYLTFLYQSGCQLTPTLQRNDIDCPPALARWSSVWLIAHNAWLHWLLEAGVIGLSGLLAVMGAALWRAARRGDPLILAVLFGFTAMNLVDVTLALPSPHFAELWWVAVGLSLGGAAAASAAPGSTAAVRPGAAA